MIYLRPKIAEINQALSKVLTSALIHGIVEPVLVDGELLHYEANESDDDWKEAGLWGSGEDGQDPDTVIYHKVYGESYQNSDKYGLSGVVAVVGCRLFIRSKYDSTHGLALKQLFELNNFVSVEASNFNKPEIIQQETLRLELMNIKEYVSSISYTLYVSMSTVACLNPQSC